MLLNIEINERQTERWRNGFEIQGRHVRPIALSALDREPRGRWLRVVIGEGLKREVRTMAGEVKIVKDLEEDTKRRRSDAD